MKRSYSNASNRHTGFPVSQFNFDKTGGNPAKQDIEGNNDTPGKNTSIKNFNESWTVGLLNFEMTDARDRSEKRGKISTF